MADYVERAYINPQIKDLYRNSLTLQATQRRYQAEQAGGILKHLLEQLISEYIACLGRTRPIITDLTDGNVCRNRSGLYDQGF